MCGVVCEFLSWLLLYINGLRTACCVVIRVRHDVNLFFCRFIGSGTMCVCVCVSRQYVSSIYPRRLVCFFFICLNFQHDFHKSLDYRIASLSTGNKVRQWHCKLLVMTGQRHWHCVQRLSSQFCNIEMENSFNFIKWVCNVILSASE